MEYVNFLRKYLRNNKLSKYVEHEVEMRLFLAYVNQVEKERKETREALKLAHADERYGHRV